MSEEQKKKIGLANKGKKLGIKHSEETKRKISEGNKGKVGSYSMLGKHHTEEARRKISEAKRGMVSVFLGKHHSEETKEKLRKARIGKHLSEETKRKISEKAKMKIREKNHNWKGGVKMEDGYRCILIGKKKYIREHRLIWLRANGEIPKGMIIHHINKNKLDNRIENLQMMTQSKHVILHKTKLKGDKNNGN